MSVRIKSILCRVLLLTLVFSQLVNANRNENTHYLPALDCYDNYGRPQVSIFYIFLISSYFLMLEMNKDVYFSDLNFVKLCRTPRVVE